MAQKFKTEQDFVNFVLFQFAQEVIEQRIEQVKATKSIATAELLRSYRYEIRKATIQQTALALFYFQEHGRFLDMRRINRKKQIPIKEIKEWIQAKGLSAFRAVPTDGRKPVGQDRLLNNLAWGIVKSSKKRKRKRRKLQKGWGLSIENLIIELGAGYQDRTIEEISNAFKS